MHAHTERARAGEGRPETRHPQTLAGCLASLKDRTWTCASPAPPAPPPVPHKQTFSGQDVEHRKASASGTAETMIIVQKKKKGKKNHGGGGGGENITLTAKKESLVGGSRKPPLLASQHANPSLFKLAKY